MKTKAKNAPPCAPVSNPDASRGTGQRQCLAPAARPCGSCPYRRDVPSGVWSAHEYLKLPAYDAPTPFQPLGIFMCHQQDGTICAGWAGTHDMRDSLAVRVADSTERLAPGCLVALAHYATDVPLFSSGTEAAKHGLAEIDNPGHGAARIIKTSLGKRSRRATSTSVDLCD